MEWNSPEVSCIFLPLLSWYLSPLSSLLPPPLISLPSSLFLTPWCFSFYLWILLRPFNWWAKRSNSNLDKDVAGKKMWEERKLRVQDSWNNHEKEDQDRVKSKVKVVYIPWEGTQQKLEEGKQKQDISNVKEQNREWWQEKSQESFLFPNGNRVRNFKSERIAETARTFSLKKKCPSLTFIMSFSFSWNFKSTGSERWHSMDLVSGCLLFQSLFLVTRLSYQKEQNDSSVSFQNIEGKDSS